MFRLMSDWTCSQCTFSNPSSARKCTICHVPFFDLEKTLFFRSFTDKHFSPTFAHYRTGLACLQNLVVEGGVLDLIAHYCLGVLYKGQPVAVRQWPGARVQAHWKGTKKKSVYPATVIDVHLNPDATEPVRPSLLDLFLFLFEVP